MNGNGNQYQRSDIKRSEEPHALYLKFGAHGQLEAMKNDPGYVQQSLADLHDHGIYILESFQKALEKYEAYENEPEVKDLKQEVVEQRKAAILREPREIAYSHYKASIDKAQMRVDAAADLVMGLTAPKTSATATQAQVMERSAREAAIWQYLLNLDPKDRSDAIRGNEERLRAVANSPVPIISDESLQKLRRDFAFDHRPDLIQQHDDAVHLRDAVRRRAANINATITKMLIEKKIDNPDIEPDPRIHFSVFGARTPWEKHQIEGRILAYDRRQEALKNRLERLAKDSGAQTFETEKVNRKLQGIERKGAKRDESGERKKFESRRRV